MKVLQLSQQFPFPETDGGRIGIANIYRGLAKAGAELTIFCYNKQEISNSDSLEANKYGKLVVMKHSIENTLFRIFKSVYDYKPIYIRKHFNDKIKYELDKLIDEVDFDIIHTDHTAMAEAALYIKNKTGKPASLRLHNIEWKIWKRYADELIFSPRKMYIEHQAKLLKHFEENILKEFEVLIPITQVDYDYLKTLHLNNKIVVASAGVDTDKWRAEKIIRNPNEIIIATTYGWVHNVDGIIWFIEKVLPLIKKQNPDAFLTLLGKEMPERLKRYNFEDVKAIGFVDSVLPYLNKASVYITPLFVGAGIRVKILEAMAMELPVVATSIASEGIEASEEDGLLLADNEYDFSYQVIKLMKDKQLRNVLGKNARNLIESKYTWNSSIAVIYNAYSEIIKSTYS